MIDLITFLRARLDEDERAAREAAGAAWVTDVPGMIHVDPFAIAENRHGLGKLGYVANTDLTPQGDAYRRHIARHDPARALREVEAKRGIARWHGPSGKHITFWDDALGIGTRCGACGSDPCRHECVSCGYLDEPCPTLALLALPYADHADYRPEWSV